MTTFRKPFSLESLASQVEENPSVVTTDELTGGGTAIGAGSEQHPEGQALTDITGDINPVAVVGECETAEVDRQDTLEPTQEGREQERLNWQNAHPPFHGTNPDIVMEAYEQPAYTSAHDLVHYEREIQDLRANARMFEHMGKFNPRRGRRTSMTRVWRFLLIDGEPQTNVVEGARLQGRSVNTLVSTLAAIDHTLGRNGDLASMLSRSAEVVNSGALPGLRFFDNGAIEIREDGVPRISTLDRMSDTTRTGLTLIGSGIAGSVLMGAITPVLIPAAAINAVAMTATGIANMFRDEGSNTVFTLTNRQLSEFIRTTTDQAERLIKVLRTLRGAIDRIESQLDRSKLEPEIKKQANKDLAAIKALYSIGYAVLACTVDGTTLVIERFLTPN